MRSNHCRKLILTTLTRRGTLLDLQGSLLAAPRRLCLASSIHTQGRRREKLRRPYSIRNLSQESSTGPLMDQHSRTVEDIAATVRHFYERKEKFRIAHGSTNSTRQIASKGKNIVNTGSLSNVLKVDTVNRTALVEPNVPMDRLVEETMKYDLVPPVVMEFPGITVGGGYAGTSGESSSFKYGFFNHTINYVEMVLANGDVVKCSDKEMPDLFYGAAGAVGTLGVTTLVELQLKEAKKFVETTYHPVSSMSEAVSVLQELSSNPEIDYLDGIMFSKSQGAIITGRLTDSPKQSLPIQCFSHARDPWFYLHVQDQVRKRSGPITEAIPLAEYLFRYDRGGFWVGKSAFDYFHMPFNKYTRWFLDDFLHTRMMYSALHASGESDVYVVQDLALPYSTAEQFVDFTDKTFGIYPLWLCPLRQSPPPTMHPHSHEKEADGVTPKPMLNIGLWGYGPPRREDFVRLNRELEHKLRELGGMKWLYAHTYYTEEEFWQVYDKEWYDGLRAKYGATSLPSVYEKVKVDVGSERTGPATARAGGGVASWIMHYLWPLNGLYGITKAIESGTYLQARASTWKASKKGLNSVPLDR